MVCISLLFKFSTIDRHPSSSTSMLHTMLKGPINQEKQKNISDYSFNIPLTITLLGFRSGRASVGWSVWYVSIVMFPPYDTRAHSLPCGLQGFSTISLKLYHYASQIMARRSCIHVREYLTMFAHSPSWSVAVVSGYLLSHFLSESHVLFFKIIYPTLPTKPSDQFPNAFHTKSHDIIQLLYRSRFIFVSPSFFVSPLKSVIIIITLPLQ